MSFNIEFIGFLAAILTTVAFIPQVYKVWQTKSVSGMSLTMYLIFFTGVSLWLVYGLIINSLPMILGNSITLLLTSIILYFLLNSKGSN
jgi:MtN3 and saliva related transmembrane protein|tara:strand:+ start:9551 stop:9817 length:267 start_codon:yes stop_codon:yes gene_type:complete